MGVYTPILTTVGSAKLANAIASGVPVQITHMAVGDGNGNPVTPSPAQTSLVREKYRSTVNRITVRSGTTSKVEAELVVPSASDGGYTIREVGVFDADGNLFAVSAFPATYKPTSGEGGVKDVLTRLILEVGNASAITLVVDPNVIIASRAWTNDLVANKLLPLGGTVGQIPMKKSNANGDVEWKDPTSVTVNVLAKSESQTLAANQTIVNLSTITTVGIALYVEGSREFDFTVNSSTQVTLGRSYPDGTRVFFVQNDPLSEVVASSVAYGAGTVATALADLQTQINTKQATLTGAATTVASSDLTALRVVVSSATGKISVSPVTTTELGYLAGVTSALPTQLADKISKTDTSLQGIASNLAGPSDFVIGPNTSAGSDSGRLNLYGAPTNSTSRAAGITILGADRGGVGLGGSVYYDTANLTTPNAAHFFRVKGATKLTVTNTGATQAAILDSLGGSDTTALTANVQTQLNDRLILSKTTLQTIAGPIASDKCYMGVWSAESNSARFGHSSFNTATGYGFLQTGDGSAFIGVPSTKTLRVINGFDVVNSYVRFEADGLWLGPNVVPAAADNSAKVATTSWIISKLAGYVDKSASVLQSITGPLAAGKAWIGEGASEINSARFGHSSFNTATGYGFLQTGDGSAFIGVPSTKTLRVINGFDVVNSYVRFEADGLWLGPNVVPAAADNSSKAATTGWVVSKLAGYVDKPSSTTSASSGTVNPTHGQVIELTGSASLSNAPASGTICFVRNANAGSWLLTFTDIGGASRTASIGTSGASVSGLMCIRYGSGWLVIGGA